MRTRDALQRALLRLLEVKPLDQITIRDICAVSKVGYTTFFRHHPTKGALLNDVAADQIRQLIGLTMPAADAADSRAGSLALFTYVAAHRALWFTLLTGGAAGSMREEFLRLSREIAATRDRPGRWPPAEVVVILVGASTIELLSWWLKQRIPLSVDQMAEIHDELIVKPAKLNLSTSMS
jgi:AcrR family transcriptional regulator